jgi:hypothetical protein
MKKSVHLGMNVNVHSVVIMVILSKVWLRNLADCKYIHEPQIGDAVGRHNDDFK